MRYIIAAITAFFVAVPLIAPANAFGGECTTRACNGDMRPW